MKSKRALLFMLGSIAIAVLLEVIYKPAPDKLIKVEQTDPDYVTETYENKDGVTYKVIKKVNKPQNKKP